MASKMIPAPYGESEPSTIQTLDSSGNILDEGKKKTDDALVAYVVEKLTTFQSQRSVLEKKWDVWYRQWRCQEDPVDTTRQSEKSQIKVPACKEAINNATDAIFQIVCGGDWFDLAPRPVELEGMDQAMTQQALEKKFARSRVVKDYISYLFDRENVEDTIHSIIQDMCIYGTGIGRVKAVERVNRRVERTNRPESIKAEDGTILDVMNVEEVRSVEQQVNHPEFEHIPLENIYVNCQASGLQLGNNCEGLVIRSYKKRFELKNLYRTGVVDATPTSNEIQQGRLGRQGISSAQTDEDVEMLEWWGFVPNEILAASGFEENGEGGLEMCVIVANRQDRYKAVENPFPTKERPFLACKFDKTSNEFYGVGIMEIAWGPQQALDASARSRIDNKALSLNNMFAINSDKFTVGQNLDMYPGKVFLFRGNPQEAIMPLIIPDVTANADRDMVIFERFIRGAHGISPLIGGMPAKSGEQTATEVSSMLGQAATRIRTIVRRFEKAVIEPMLRWYSRIILQYINQRELFLLTDSETGSMILREITPEDAAEDFEFVARGSTRLAETNELQKRINALQIVSNPVLAQFANIPYLLKKVYEAMGFDDVQAAIVGQPTPQQQAMVQAQGPNSGQPGQAGQPSGQPSGIIPVPGA